MQDIQNFQLIENNHSIQSFKIHVSDEIFANNQREYRVVYDVSELNALHFEIRLMNLKHLQNDWRFNCEFRAYHFSGKEILRFTHSEEISKEEFEIYIRGDWINKTDESFWKQGSYCWEVWINNHCAATTNFIVVESEIGSSTDENLLYQLESIRLFEGNAVEMFVERRQYLECFNRRTTRFVWIELNGINRRYLKNNWSLELQLNIFSANGRLKGQIEKFIQVPSDQKEIRTSAAWGTDLPGNWHIGKYRIECVHMNKLIGVLPFEVGTQVIIEKEPRPFSLEFLTGHVKSNLQAQTDSLESTIQELDEMIGLDEIKRKVREYVTYLRFLKLRSESGIDDDEPINLHSVFIGNPGTGKTTIAKLIGRIYKAMGLLGKGHIHEVDRSDLVGEFIGQTAPKTKAAIEQAEGGILFIDEAYALARKGDDAKDFGKEVIEILVKEMTDPRRNFAVIVAGYPEEMTHFLDYNPGLKSRFNQFYNFPDYSPQQLIEIAELIAKNKRISLTSQAHDLLYLKLVEAYRNRDRTFGNARYIHTTIDASKMNLGLRMMKIYNPLQHSVDQLSIIEAEDIERVFAIGSKAQLDLPVDEDLLRITLREQQQMIGLPQVKKAVDEQVKLVRFYNEIGKDFKDDFNLHALYLGNPGTGKTTVARQMSNLLKALGVLERGHLVECSRQELVAGFAGQTASKTSAIIDSAIGGTLFIDEAYTLIMDEFDSFGKEAIATLLKRMEDQRGEFVVIAAGYPGNMEKFLQSNPGLKSRFDRQYYFEDYDAGQLGMIMDFIFQKQGLELSADSRGHLLAYFDHLTRNKDAYFGNARTVRNIVEKVVKNQHLRLALMNSAQRSEHSIRLLCIDDVSEFDPHTSPVSQNRIGFRH